MQSLTTKVVKLAKLALLHIPPTLHKLSNGSPLTLILALARRQNATSNWFSLILLPLLERLFFALTAVAGVKLMFPPQLVMSGSEFVQERLMDPTGLLLENLFNPYSFIPSLNLSTLEQGLSLTLSINFNIWLWAVVRSFQATF